MRLISVYSPPTFLKPVILVSTTVHYPDDDNAPGDFDENETAVLFVEALNNNAALNKVDFTAANWKVIKKHESKQAALRFHKNLAKKLCRGHRKHWETYCELLYEYADEATLKKIEALQNI